MTRYTLSREGGPTLRVLTYMAASAESGGAGCAGSAGQRHLGFASLHGYLNATNGYFGAVVGRFADRIAGGRFTLDESSYAVDVHAAGSCLHGGTTGFDKRLWHAEPYGEHELQLTLTSPDGDQGFPGRLHVEVTYRLLRRGVRIDYSATTEAPTVINLTNHSYFNLAGEGSGSIEEHTIEIDADAFTPVGPDLIPTGEIDAVAGTPLDLRRATSIGARLRDPHPQLLAARG